MEDGRLDGKTSGRRLFTARHSVGDGWSQTEVGSSEGGESDGPAVLGVGFDQLELRDGVLCRKRFATRQRRLSKSLSPRR